MTSIKEIMKHIIRDFNSKYFTSLDNELFARNGATYDVERSYNDIKIYNRGKLLKTIKNLNDWNDFKNEEFKIIDEHFKDSKYNHKHSDEDIEFILSCYE